MRPILSPGQMAAADAAAISAGIPSFDLMRRAGAAVGRSAIRLLAGTYGRRVTVICGKGNNGGDGLVAAGWLAARGIACRVLLLEEPGVLTGDAARAFQELRGARVNQFGPAVLERELKRADLAIDALVGTGFKGGLKGPAASAASMLEGAQCPILAVDIPSGLNGETGKVEGPAVKAHTTVTLAALKPGLVLGAGEALSGNVEVADIGIPADLLKTSLNLVEEEDVRDLLPARPLSSHKRSVGKVLVVAGSLGMAGAASLAARGALRAGAGLVRVAVPESIADGLSNEIPEAMVKGLPEGKRGAIGLDAGPLVAELAEQVECIALGPGIGRDPGTVEFVEKVLPMLDLPVVLDADGINALNGRPEMLRDRSAPTVLTPHAGELSRLTGAGVNEIEKDRLSACLEAAERAGAIVLLKGHPTVVATPGGRTVLVDTGGPVLSSGGTGDVLTGVVTALGAALRAAGGSGNDDAQLLLFRAAWAGAWIHGRAGDLLAATSGERGVLAGDLARVLPAALSSVTSG